MNYYVCDYETHKALLGPMSSREVVTFINNQSSPQDFCNMSRYLLAKEGTYPNTRAGDKMLLEDLEPGSRRGNQTISGPTTSGDRNGDGEALAVAVSGTGEK